MANYKQVSYGSKGSDVTELQKLLNKNGYGLDEDGIYGSKTQAAVKDFQKKNKLAVDGIVGEETWGKITGFKPTPEYSTMGTASGVAQTTSDAKTPTFDYGEYQPSDAVKQAEAMLDQQLQQKPGEYQSTWQDQLNETISQILNRDKFSYDLNGDALYQQYKDSYIQQGKMAMMDTMGQAQAMTGGYGNSYAQSVGQQAYQAHLQRLNDVVPELYGMALDQYNREGQEMYDQAALMAQMEDQDYGRYQDAMNAWLAERDYLTGRYDSERDYDYGQYIDDRSYHYQKDRDKVADEQWQAEFDEAKRQYDQQYALQKSKGSGGTSSRKSEKPSETSSKYGGLSESEVRDLIAAKGNYDAAANLVYDMVDDGFWGEDFLISILEELYPELRYGVGTPTGGGHSGKNTVNKFN